MIVDKTKYTSSLKLTKYIINDARSGEFDDCPVI